MTAPEMTPEKATALRRPFPPESIGKLPKGGQMLDFAGHAAVTDRLLAVDPFWSWEPFAIGPDGLPAIDQRGNLWIRLTVCGVTRIGVGDGAKNAKELISDALRNAAMRFGVALDLWAKENLVEFAQASHAPPTQPAQTHDERVIAELDEGQPPLLDEPPDEAKPPKWGSHAPMQAKTRGRLFALFTEQGIEDRDEQLRGINHIIGKELTSRSELTEPDAKLVIAKLEERKAARAS